MQKQLALLLQMEPALPGWIRQVSVLRLHENMVANPVCTIAILFMHCLVCSIETAGSCQDCEKQPFMDENQVIFYWRAYV